MELPNKQRNIDPLKQVLLQEDTVLFIGSGISLWAGLPTWSNMIEELATFVERSGASADLIRQEAKKGDLLQAASYGFDKLTKQQIGDFVRSACRYGRAKPHEIHRKIVTLGPRCFITTNYDDLIEQGLRLWQPDRFYRPPVTNRHLTETAEIVHARATDFIFKPHGDAGDSESIILTREQYRQLLPQGERQAALESVKMLLASRPVVYFGFGLRDPDFIYVRDLLANTYKGGSRDHYAVVADVQEQEIDYWRRNYGIHLIGYETTQRENEAADHTPLLELLDLMLKQAASEQQSAAFKPRSPEVLLALARHAAALSRTPKQAPEYSIRVRAESLRKDSLIGRRMFDHSRIDSFLTEGPDRAVLTGLPGAGKSYSMRRAAAHLAERLHEASLAAEFDQISVIVPVFVDLKLYHGNLRQLVNQTLPGGLPLDELISSFRVKIFLDSFNELPREYWESGAYEADFQHFFDSIGETSVVISSRTSDGLNKLEIPFFCLDQIDQSIVESELDRLRINVDGRFRLEMIHLLQRPFFFRYVTTGAINLPAAPHPRDFYKSLLDNTRDRFTSRFGINLDIERVLSPVAYEALNRGEEAFPLGSLITILQAGPAAESLVQAGISASDLANWLVSDSLLVPYSGSRVAFIHQSITEYLASTELARRYLSNSLILIEKMALKRWDQALFFTLSLLPFEQANVFLQDVIKCDFELALNASKYMESGRDAVIAELLEKIPTRCGIDLRREWSVAWTMENLPLTEAHEPQLRLLVKLGNTLGGTALAKLIAIKGEQMKAEALPMLLGRWDDFNFCQNGLAPALAPYVTEDDAIRIACLADELDLKINPEDDEDCAAGFVSGASTLLGSLDLCAVERIFIPSNRSAPVPKTRGRVLCNLLRDNRTTMGLTIAGDLLLRGVNEAAMVIAFVGKFAKLEDESSWASFTSEHVTQLESLLEVERSSAVEALRYLCAARPDLSNLVNERAHQIHGLRKAVFLYCTAPNDLRPIFSALGELLDKSDAERKILKYEPLLRIEFDWTGKEVLFTKLMNLQDARLASALLGGSIPPDLPGLGCLNIEDIEPWLEWTLELAATSDYFWLSRGIGALLAEHVSQTVKQKLIAEFQREDSKFRALLLRNVIPHFTEITTDAFNENTISFLLADLRREGSVWPLDGHLLGSAATERFVAERLLPLLPAAADGTFSKNLRKVLEQAGGRHGIRYLIG
ncbi:SIR2 family protein [Cupriavidus numazuensis]|uniref:SIR2-like domain-containing protein n=1 Tax=Cupriavidus numazuensis TaxID=221992 RepID=A0ABM8TN16_9BURK|nr:SIR2 family protein [Cupriavidus numazuensis]CAG2155540.1 hypothetical protein LMG26411_04959 [Cupriavidus numazuensis]